jgi:transcription elongation factor Elf1
MVNERYINECAIFTPKGSIPCPVCGKSKVMVSADAKGHTSYECKVCGRFIMIDADNMTAVQSRAIRQSLI